MGDSRKSSGAMLSVKSMTWEEDPTSLTVDLTIPGVSSKNVDIFTTENYLKVYSKPYLWTADLFGEIDEDQSAVSIGDGSVKMKLMKREPGVWGSLTSTLEPTAIKERREKSKAAAELKQQAAVEAKKKEKADQARKALEAQMDLDRVKRETVQKQKDAEKKAAEAGLNDWVDSMKQSREPPKSEPEPYDPYSLPLLRKKNKQPAYLEELPAEESAESLLETSRTKQLSDAPKPTSASGAKFAKEGETEKAMRELEEMRLAEKRSSASVSSSPASKDIFGDSDTTSSVPYLADVKSPLPPKSQAASNPDLPPVRQTVNITASFTPRPSNTPAREPRDYVPPPLPATQIQPGQTAQDASPAWLKDKGDRFFQHGDYRAAINAYSQAVDADPGNWACFSNRAACFLKLGHAHGAVEDTTRAVQILDHAKRAALESMGAVPEPSVQSYARVLVRRGTAYALLGDYVNAHADLERALKVRPDDEQLKKDFAEVTSHLDATNKVWLRTRGDDLYMRNDYAGAIAVYSKAILADEDFAACYSNRAACYLKLGQVDEAVTDCDRALQIYRRSGAVVETLARVHTRKALALSCKGMLKEAVNEYTTASGLCPDRTDLKEDLVALRTAAGVSL